MFIFISLILHFLALYLIFRLFKREPEQKNSEYDLDVMEEMFQEFSKEIKLENEKLKSYIEKRITASSQTQIEKKEEVKNDEVHLHSSEEKKDSNEKVDPELNEVILLSKQGFTANEIAKKLNRGKGEIELLLKFYA